MNTESTIRMYREHLGPTFRRRREDLDLVGERGGIIFDAFSGNEGRGFGEDVDGCLLVHMFTQPCIYKYFTQSWDTSGGAVI